MLGNSSPGATLGIYARATVDTHDQAAAVMEEIVAPVAIELSQPRPIAARCNREIDPQACDPPKGPKTNKNTAE